MWPGGVLDIPTDLAFAVQHAEMILSWYENLSAKDLPPEWMWTLEHELESWFSDSAAAERSGTAVPDEDMESNDDDDARYLRSLRH